MSGYFFKNIKVDLGVFIPGIALIWAKVNIIFVFYAFLRMNMFVKKCM